LSERERRKEEEKRECYRQNPAGKEIAIVLYPGGGGICLAVEEKKEGIYGTFADLFAG